MFLNLASLLPATWKPQGFANANPGVGEPCSSGQASRPDRAQLLGTDAIFELELATMAVDLRKRMRHDQIRLDMAGSILFNEMQRVERDRSKVIAAIDDGLVDDHDQRATTLVLGHELHAATTQQERSGVQFTNSTVAKFHIQVVEGGCPLDRGMGMTLLGLAFCLSGCPHEVASCDFCSVI